MIIAKINLKGLGLLKGLTSSTFFVIINPLVEASDNKSFISKTFYAL